MVGIIQRPYQRHESRKGLSVCRNNVHASHQHATQTTGKHTQPIVNNIVSNYMNPLVERTSAFHIGTTHNTNAFG